MKRLVDLLEGVALALDQHIREAVAPRVDKSHRFALVDLVRLDLVCEEHELVAVDKSADEAPDERYREREARVLLHAERERDDWHEFKARLLERLSQQEDVVGRAAAAACLGDHQRGLVHVVFAALERVNELTDYEQRRVTGVVVDIFQTCLRDFGACGLEQLRLVAVVDKDVFEHFKMYGRHVRHEDCVLTLHLLGKEQPPCFFVILQICHKISFCIGWS